MSSKLTFIEPILEAIAKLAERNGSSAKNILNYLRKREKIRVKRNLTLQVRKALKEAVVQGVIRLRGGRYKAPRYPTKKLAHAVEKERNCAPVQSVRSGKQLARHNKVDKFTKNLTKGNQSDTKSHAAQKAGKAGKAGKAKKKRKPPTK